MVCDSIYMQSIDYGFLGVSTRGHCQIRRHFGILRPLSRRSSST